MTPSAEVAATAARALGLSPVPDWSVLAERPGATVVIALGHGGHTVIAKVGLNDRCDGSRAAGALRVLSALPAEQLRPLAVPRLVLHDRAMRLLVTEPARGVPLDRAVQSADLPALRQAGAALARLHAAPVVIGPGSRLPDHLADLVRPQPGELAVELPDVAVQVTDLVAALGREAPTGIALRPIHRDLHPRQMHTDQARTWMLDWDLAAQGDPALDIGNFCAYVRARHDGRIAEPVVRAFVDGYAAADDGSGEGALTVGRAHVYESFTYLRLACKRFRLAGTDARPEIRTLLVAAERRLSRGCVREGVGT